MMNRTCFHLAIVGLMLVGLPSDGRGAQASQVGRRRERTRSGDGRRRSSTRSPRRRPTGEGHYAAALYFPNVQLLVISGRYSAPQLMEPRLAGKQYRDTYMELSGTVAPDSKIFVQDMGEPGLSPKKQDNMYDTWTQAGKIVMFDGDNEKQKMSDAEYAKAFAAADEEYARILGALLAEAKK